MENEKIGIINYGAGNIFSLTATLERLGLSYGMVNHPGAISDYNRFIIPGVGHAGQAMQKLEDTGLVEAILSTELPVLGICVGMQLLTRFSEEGNKELLKIFPLDTLHFAKRIKEKVPHMGWNTVAIVDNHPLFQGLKTNAYFYFVHSYFVPYEETFTIGTTNYGIDYSAAIAYNNYVGVQFHPEKSGNAGEQVLINFAKLNLKTLQ